MRHFMKGKSQEVGRIGKTALRTYSKVKLLAQAVADGEFCKRVVISACNANGFIR